MPRRGMAHNSPNPHNRQSLNTARQKAISCCADSAHEVIYSIDYNHKSFQPITGQTQRQSSNDRFASVFRPWCNLQHQLLWAQSRHSLHGAPTAVSQDIPDFDALIVNGCFQSLAATRLLSAALNSGTIPSRKSRSRTLRPRLFLPFRRTFSRCLNSPLFEKQYRVQLGFRMARMERRKHLRGRYF